MTPDQLVKKMLTWLSREELRLLEQRSFLEQISLFGGLTSVNASIASGIQDDFEQALAFLGDLEGYLNEL